MSSTSDEIKTSAIKSLPNSIDGNGSSFIDKLKKVLVNFGYSIADNASTAANVSQVTELTLTETTVTSGSSTSKAIYVQFNKDNVKKYKEARIWMRTSSKGAFTLDGITNTGDYTKAGVSDSTVYYIKVVAVDENDNVADFDLAPVSNITISAGVSENPSPPTGLVVTWKSGIPTWSWQASSSPGGDGAFYELRTDENTGYITNRLAMVPWVSGKTDYSCNGTPTINVGTAYLYFCNTSGVYSAPLKKDFTLPGVVRPDPPRFEKTENGFLVLMDDFPAGVVSATVEVTSNGSTNTYTTNTSTKALYSVWGTYKVRYRFNLAATSTEWSEYQTYEHNLQIDGSTIESGTITSSQVYSGSDLTKRLSATQVSLAALNDSGTLNANTVGTNQIITGAVTTNEIASGTIQANNIATDALFVGTRTSGGTTSTGIVAIENGAVAADKLTAVNVVAQGGTISQLEADHLFAAIVAAGTISATKITTNCMTAGTINGDRITAGTLKADQLETGTLTITGESDDAITIVNGAINGVKIEDYTIEATKIKAGVLQVGTSGGTTGAVTICNGAITANMIETDALFVGQKTTGGTTTTGIVTIQNNAITAGMIQADVLKVGTNGSVTIEDGAIDADMIAANALFVGTNASGETGVVTIQNNAITAGMIQANSIGAGQLSTSLITLTGNQGISGGGMTLTSSGLSINGGAGSGSARIVISTNLIEVYDSSNTLRVRLGVWSE